MTTSARGDSATGIGSAAPLPDYEKLGAFYLGRGYDPEQDRVRDEDILYDSRDLTTHALCVGMTGSGKTGLCVGLLEEAAIDGIPSIIIDPKGDMGNLLLTFPELRAADFEPWVDPDEAARRGQTKAGFATQTAALWKKGLAEWGQDGARIARLRAAADFQLYTPGSSIGRPLRVLRSFDAPPAQVMADRDALSEQVEAAVSGLLALLGISADPLRSREAILLQNILLTEWREGRSLDLGGLIRAIQKPPFTRLGVFDLDAFFPDDDRFLLAMQMNNLLASPSFASWMEGEPLSIPRLLAAEDGRPRVSVISIAHLSDSERMFFVTLLLNEVIGWMRSQPGTTSLRAILYMDEIFGYFPPTREPPSKRPMLTLLKQARAFGVGVVLATQNPVDLDYKGLSNCGTWFLGRLQTERDKARVLDGLEGAMADASGRFDRKEMDRLLSGLGKRVFLMNNVHERAPVLMQTRWAMSYLRGPLARDQIRALCHPVDAGAPVHAGSSAQAGGSVLGPRNAGGSGVDEKEPSAAASNRAPPVIDSEIQQRFLEPRLSLPAGLALQWIPTLLVSARIHFANAASGLDVWWDRSVVVPLLDDGLDLDRAVVEVRAPRFGEPSDGVFADVPRAGIEKKQYPAHERAVRDHLYRTVTLSQWKCRDPKLTSNPGEDLGAFRVRVVQVLREERDRNVEKLRAKYAPKLQTIEDRIRRAEAKVDREEAQYKQARTDSVFSIGASLLGALFGRKLASVTNVRRAGSAARGVGKTSKERADIGRAEEEVEEQRQRLAELEAEFQAAIEEQNRVLPADAVPLEEVLVRPRKADLEVARPVLLWRPHVRSRAGALEPAYELDDA